MSNVIKIKKTYTNIYTGKHTWEILNNFGVIRDFLEDQGKSVDDIRDHKENSKGLPTFSSGIGYDIIDKDLLGGSGDGYTYKKFKHDTGYSFEKY